MNEWINQCMIVHTTCHGDGGGMTREQRKLMGNSSPKPPEWAEPTGPGRGLGPVPSLRISFSNPMTSTNSRWALISYFSFVPRATMIAATTSEENVVTTMDNVTRQAEAMALCTRLSSLPFLNYGRSAHSLISHLCRLQP